MTQTTVDTPVTPQAPAEGQTPNPQPETPAQPAPGSREAEDEMDAWRAQRVAQRYGRTAEPAPEAPGPETKIETPAAETPASEVKTEEKKPAETPKPEGKGKEAIRQRFSEMTAKIRDLEARLASSQQAPAAAPQNGQAPAQTAEEAEPNLDNYTDYAKWQKDHASWSVKQALKEQAKQSQTQTVQTAAQDVVRAKMDLWNERVNAAKQETPDFEQIAQNKDLKITRDMGQAIVESELGTDILYHLGKNPDLAAKIAALTPHAQVREIGKIEAKLEAQAPASTPAPLAQSVAVSSAPPPTTGIKARANTVKDADSISMEEWRAHREAQRRRKSGA